DSSRRPQFRLNRALESYVDLVPINEARLIHDTYLAHEQIFAGAELTRPFSTAYFQTAVNPRIRLPLSINNQWLGYVWKAAAYVVTLDGSPTWYQVTVKVDQHLPTKLTSDPAGMADINATRHNWLSLVRLGAERPTVTWQRLTLG